MSFAFKPEEEWAPTGGILPKGNYICEIVDIDAEQTTSRNNDPMVVVKTANEDGEITNWIAIMTLESGGNTFGKFTNLVLAAGVPEANWPQPGRDFDPNTGKISQDYCDRYLYGKKVGVFVREEEDKRPTSSRFGQMRETVKGYVKPEEITNPGPFAGAGASTGNGASATQSSGAAPAATAPGQPVIPF